MKPLCVSQSNGSFIRRPSHAKAKKSGAVPMEGPDPRKKISGSQNACVSGFWGPRPPAGIDCPWTLSVCLSVTSVDQDHIGWKYWKLTALAIGPTIIFGLRSLKAIAPNPRRTHGKLGETVGWKKWRAMEHKSGNTPETRKDRG